jgi:hypothetical protein
MVAENQGVDTAKQLEDLLEVNEGTGEDLILGGDAERVSSPDEFDEIDLSGGIDTIADEFPFASCEPELLHLVADVAAE